MAVKVFFRRKLKIKIIFFFYFLGMTKTVKSGYLLHYKSEFSKSIIFFLGFDFLVRIWLFCSNLTFLFEFALFYFELFCPKLTRIWLFSSNLPFFISNFFFQIWFFSSNLPFFISNFFIRIWLFLFRTFSSELDFFVRI